MENTLFYTVFSTVYSVRCKEYCVLFVKIAERFFCCKVGNLICLFIQSL